MALFFGTDGLRGEVDKFLNTKIILILCSFTIKTWTVHTLDIDTL